MTTYIRHTGTVEFRHEGLDYTAEYQYRAGELHITGLTYDSEDGERPVGTEHHVSYHTLEAIATDRAWQEMDRGREESRRNYGAY